MTAAILGMASGAQSQAAEHGVKAEQPAAEERLLFAMIYSPGPKWQQGKPFREQIGIKEHFGYMKGLFAKGQTFSAGGLGVDQGLVLFHARNQTEAEAVLAADPMVQAGSFTGVVRRYSPTFLSEEPLTASKN